MSGKRENRGTRKELTAEEKRKDEEFWA